MSRTRGRLSKITLLVGIVCALMVTLVSACGAPLDQRPGATGHAGMDHGGMVAGSMAQPAAVRAAALSPTIPHAIGRKQITCTYTASNSDDMLVKPGMVGASHEHDYFGAFDVTANTTLGTIRGHGTSCPQAADESGYWTPSLQIGTTTFRPSAAHVYYERNTTKPVSAFPDDFHMIVGNAMNMSDDSGNPRIFFGCAGSEDGRSTRVTVSSCTSKASSSTGPNTFAIWLEFPNCWDGKPASTPSLNLTYATGSSAKCPADHPVLLPSLHYTVWYDLPKAQKLTGVRLASGPIGSAHADFVNGWTTAAMASMVKCINTNNRTCP